MNRMRAVSLLLATLLVPAAGCSRTLVMRRPVTLEGARHVTQAAAGQTVKVEYLAPDRPAAQTEVREGVLAIADGSAFVLRTPPEEPRRIPFERTHTVVVKDRRRGALVGFVAGAIPGAIVGLVVGSAFDSMGCSDNGSGSKTDCPIEGTLTLGIGGAVLTALIGTIIGSSVGHRTTFTF